MKVYKDWLLTFLVAFAALLSGACENTGKKSAEFAQAHAEFLAKAVRSDLKEVRDGLPQGAKTLVPVFQAAGDQPIDYQTADRALKKARSSVQDLRVAKSTFFLMAQTDGTIVRNNLDEDEMAGKNLLAAYPELKGLSEKDYLEVTGSWEIARGVNGRPDGQWVAAARVDADGKQVGTYATGWSWSSYAYRLENNLRAEILGATESGEKVPLIYVYVIVGENTYGAPIAPMVNAEAVMKLDPVSKLKDGKFSEPLEITGRQFGVAVQEVPELQPGFCVVVVRSET